ncbi:hypothetical protein LPJ58_006322, partial [Coemansia sp. RSA 1591]
RVAVYGCCQTGQPTDAAAQGALANGVCWNDPVPYAVRYLRETEPHGCVYEL